MAAVLNTNEPSAGWRAELSLTFAHDTSRTVLARKQHIGPLVVQRPFYPEGPDRNVCHVYLVHPPGGIVGGDRLRFDATLQPQAHSVITTPAATKFYRTLPDRHAVLDQTLRAQDATLEWLPQETILFREARAHTTTRIELAGRSRFIGWELMCYGRPACNELFDNGNAKQQLEVWIDEYPVLLDRLHIDGENPTMRAPWGLAGHSLLGTLLAYPAIENDLEAARVHEGFACTLVDGVLSCRLVSNDADTAKRSFVHLWRTLRPRIVGREAVLPRIWAT
jgi:urease accessory protein